MSFSSSSSKQDFDSGGRLPFPNQCRHDGRSGESQAESLRSLSCNQDMLAPLASAGQPELQCFASATPQVKLGCMLSVKSVISTTSSFPSHRMEKAQAYGVAGLYRSIGAGTCGVVFEELGTVKAIKLAKTNDSQLWNDYRFHTLTVEKFALSPLHAGEELSIPKCHWFVDRKDREWWEVRRDRFPHQHRVATPTDAMCMERILPLPKELRYAIIDQWCPENPKEMAKADKANSDCLVRVYLGKRRQPRTRPPTTFSLRNFNLCVDQIQELNIAEYENVARTMGQALAILHWSIGTDARDVEFVLGSTPTPAETPMTASQLTNMAKQSTWKQVTQHNFRHRAVRLWLLDFNQCREISRNGEGIKMAVEAFFQNDPYFPRPLSSNLAEQELWNTFRTGYEQMGKWALQKATDTEKGLPATFLEACVVEQQARLQRQAAAAARTSVAEAYS